MCLTSFRFYKQLLLCFFSPLSPSFVEQITERENKKIASSRSFYILALMESLRCPSFVLTIFIQILTVKPEILPNLKIFSLWIGLRDKLSFLPFYEYCPISSVLIVYRQPPRPLSPCFINPRCNRKKNIHYTSPSSLVQVSFRIVHL